MLVENVTCICNVKSLTSAYKLLAQLMLLIYRRVKIAPGPDIKLIQNNDLLRIQFSEKRITLDKGEGLLDGRAITGTFFWRRCTKAVQVLSSYTAAQRY